MFFVSLALSLNFALAKQCHNLFKFNIFRDTEVVFLTGNAKKQRVISEYLEENNIQAEFRNEDVKEINADSLKVATHKATSVYQEGKVTVVEDTSLHVDYVSIGPLIKWNIDKLGQSIGRNAKIEIIFAYYHKNRVETFHAYLKGKIAKPEEGIEKPGMDDYFIPDGYEQSIAQLRSEGLFDSISPRLEALRNLERGMPNFIAPPIHKWDGPWQ